jgi:hypothetical protein
MEIKYKSNMRVIYLADYDITEEGVTLHFYALLITALLELRLKQQCVALCETALSAYTSPQTEADPPPIAGLMINPERLAGTRGNTFLATVGEKLHRYGLAPSGLEDQQTLARRFAQLPGPPL